MAVTRGYHQARSHNKTMGILNEETEEKLDPRVMTIFRNAIKYSEFKVT